MHERKQKMADMVWFVSKNNILFLYLNSCQILQIWNLSNQYKLSFFFSFTMVFLYFFFRILILINRSLKWLALIEIVSNLKLAFTITFLQLIRKYLYHFLFHFRPTLLSLYLVDMVLGKNSLKSQHGKNIFSTFFDEKWRIEFILVNDHFTLHSSAQLIKNKNKLHNIEFV